MKQLIAILVVTYFNEIFAELSYKIVKLEKCTGDNIHIKMDKCELLSENFMNIRFNYLQPLDYVLVSHTFYYRLFNFLGLYRKMSTFQTEIWSIYLNGHHKLRI